MSWYEKGYPDWDNDYEPDYDVYFEELKSIESLMANVGCYNDWFIEIAHKSKFLRTKRVFFNNKWWLKTQPPWIRGPRPVVTYRELSQW